MCSVKSIMSGDSEIISKFRDMGVSDRSDMVSKEYAWIPDMNGSSYNGQITFDLSSLGQSQKWVNYSEAYIEIPYVIAAKASVDFTAAGIITANTIGMKDGFHQIIDSIAVEINGRTGVQVQNFTNFHTQFKLLTSSSFDDIFKNGATTGFFGDDVSTMTYNVVASANGVGYCNSNNSNFTNRKGQTTKFDVSAANLLPTIANAEAINAGRSYFKNDGAAAARIYYWVVMAQIRLSDITDLFAKMPICKTTDIRLTITYNSSQVVVNCVNVGDTLAVGSYQQISGHTCPFMLSPFTVPADGTLTIRSNVMKSGLGENPTLAVTNCRLYVPIYKPSDSVSLAMIQSFPTSVVEYLDIYTYVVPEITAGQTFCHTLTTGIVDPMYVVVIPLPKTNGLAGLGTATYQSIFDSCPGSSSGIIIRDFNVQLAGINIFQSNQHYDFEQFNAELSKINAINGNMTLGFTSGIISYYMFQQGYRIYVADLSRKDSSQSNVTKSITITGVNTTVSIPEVAGPPVIAANPNSIELLCFVAYKKKIVIQTSTGILQD